MKSVGNVLRKAFRLGKLKGKNQRFGRAGLHDRGHVSVGGRFFYIPLLPLSVCKIEAKRVKRLHGGPV